MEMPRRWQVESPQEGRDGKMRAVMEGEAGSRVKADHAKEEGQAAAKNEVEGNHGTETRGVRG